MRFRNICPLALESDFIFPSLSAELPDKSGKIKYISQRNIAAWNNCFAGHALCRQRNKRNALPMTMTSENPIANAQRTGLMNPKAASGTPMAL